MNTSTLSMSAPYFIEFLERDVVLAFARVSTLQSLIITSDVVAEFRSAQHSQPILMKIGRIEKIEFVNDALTRINPAIDSNVAVCLLDTGVMQNHPLLSPVLDTSDLHSVKPEWQTMDMGSANYVGHGTAMAGLAIYGDLLPILMNNDIVNLTHRLESIKILPKDEGQRNEPKEYANLTAQAVARVEIKAPKRNRAITLAVTDINSKEGRPTSWSTKIDEICFDPDNRRLFIISAGNIRDDLFLADHLVRNDLEPIEDPAQAWNGLTVGAFTNKSKIVDPTYNGWTPVSPTGDLSPTSRTSVMFGSKWPIKPDVVFEGGNLATDGVNAGIPIDELQLLTTHNRHEVSGPFRTIGDTSAATALAAKMAAEIWANRPRLWPETVRGLIVHSAEWTTAMRARVNACNGRKRDIHTLVRRYGYGVPDLERALLSAKNDLTLIVEDSLKPFRKDGSNVKMRNMKLHEFKWPKDILTELGEAKVEMRVTLSYFIEPNPGERGWTQRHPYGSHGLRFKLKRDDESLPEFESRVGVLTSEEDEGYASRRRGGDGKWLLGRDYRNQGSLHSDVWSGTAADLAQRDAIAVFPVGGWWKEKPYLEKWDTEARYSLIVTIKVPDIDVDIYTPVANQIAIVAEIV